MRETIRAESLIILGRLPHGRGMAVRWLDDIEDGEERDVGKKASSLATLSQYGLQVPRGFVVTAQTFEEFVRSNGLENQIESILNSVDQTDSDSVQRAANRINNLIMGADVSATVKDDIEEAYEKINLSQEVRNAGGQAVNLVNGQRETEFVAVRSSPTGTRIPGTNANELDVNGKNSVVEQVKKCWASLYSAEALSVEDEVGEIHSIAVIVQRMVDADVAGSVFGHDPVVGDRSGYIVESLWGAGNALYDGRSTPDWYCVDKNGNVVEKDIVEKEWKTVRDPKSGKTIRQRVAREDREARSLDAEDMEQVVDAIRNIEGKYGRNIRLDFVISRNRLYVLDMAHFERQSGDSAETGGDSPVTGRGAADGTAHGPVRHLYDDTDIDKVDADDIVVAVNASDRMAPMLNDVAGFVADKGGLSANIAALARKLDVPCIVAAQNATDRLSQEEAFTVHGSRGTVTDTEPDTGGDQRSSTVEMPKPPGMEASATSTDTLTATQVKVLGTDTAEAAEGAVVAAFTNYRQVVDAAEQHDPHHVWARTQDRNRFDRDNVGILTSHVTDDMDGKGVVLTTYGGVMRSDDLFDRGARFVGLDVDSLQQDGDQESLLNSIEKLGEEAAAGCESALLLRSVDDALIEKAVESGISTIAVPAEAVPYVKKTVAKSEKRFMLQKLREL